MNNLLIAPAVAIMVLSFTAGMLETAEAVQEKTLRHVDSMNTALDCAFAGIDIRICSPDIYGYDYAEDIAAASSQMKDFSDEFLAYYDEEGSLVIVKRP